MKVRVFLKEKKKILLLMILRKVSSKELGQTYSRGADFCGPVNQRRVSDGSVG